MFKVALIIDGNSVMKWQMDALREIEDLINVRLILSCTNTKNKRNIFKNFLYYVLNYLSLQNKLTRHVSVTYDDANLISFESIYEKNWQKIPDDVGRLLSDSQIDLVIKFGMSLLRIEDHLTKCKILSFHHGDPAHYRGRPAGFYELLHGNSSVGTIVQELSNKLDAGKVWAICHSKIHLESYKKTSLNFYANSKFLLKKALLNITNNEPLDLSTNGKNYRLPSNFLVLKFFTILLSRKIKRLFYGLFFEKKWNVATDRYFSISKKSILKIRNAKKAYIDRKYNFYADPFFSVDGNKIRLEALNSKNGLGEIIETDSKNLEKIDIILKGNHFSYPFSFSYNNEENLIPEVAAHSSPYIINSPISDNNKVFIKGMEKFRIVDGTIFHYNNVIYLFCGMDSSASDCLYLFYSDGLYEDFSPHPLNPIVIDPQRARMGGRVIVRDEKIYRFGQNNAYGYGDGITICEISKLSKSEYEEKIVGSLHFDDAKGPHTVDIFLESAVFDFYIDKFSLFAWYRRIVPLIIKYFHKNGMN